MPFDIRDHSPAPIQKTISFEEPRNHVAAVRYEPTDEALAAFEQMEDWRIDPRTGKTTEMAGETLYVVGKALLEAALST